VFVFVFSVTSTRNTNTVRELSTELLMFKHLVHILTTALKNTEKSEAIILLNEQDGV
jgi:hypothetical protein